MRYEPGDRVVVTHDLGEEEATVTGQARLAPGEDPAAETVHVVFDDRTRSGWPPARVRKRDTMMSTPSDQGDAKTC